MVDGFKRLRACRKLGNQSLRARVLEGHRSGAQGGLTQVEIAPLLGRDKSWVSRRIALIERLSEDPEYLRLD